MIGRLLGRTLCGIALCGLITVAHAQQKSDVTLKVGAYGGVFDQILMRYAANQFTARTGVKIQLIDANADDHLAKLIASRGRESPYDVIFLDDGIQVKAEAAGVIGKMTEADVPNLKFIYDEVKNKDGYGPAMDLYSCGITYNVQKFKEAGILAPTSWADLWNPKLAGHVAVPALDSTMGQCLLAAAEKLAGGDEGAPDKGIAKIAEIKAQSYPSSSALITALMASGDVWATVWLNGRVWNLIDAGQPYGYVLPKEGGYRGLTMIDIAAGSQHPKEAFAFINEVLGPVYQIGLVFDYSYGPSNKLLVPIMAAYPETSKKFPASPAALDKLNSINWSIFNANLPKAVQLWDRQVISK
jgi:putative spermidine/putrescine transport system substrate-binding protein